MRCSAMRCTEVMRSSPLLLMRRASDLPSTRLMRRGSQGASSSMKRMSTFVFTERSRSTGGREGGRGAGEEVEGSGRCCRLSHLLSLRRPLLTFCPPAPLERACWTVKLWTGMESRVKDGRHADSSASSSSLPNSLASVDSRRTADSEGDREEKRGTEEAEGRPTAGQWPHAGLHHRRSRMPRRRAPLASGHVRRVTRMPKKRQTLAM